jgi:hypothetical protein
MSPPTIVRVVLTCVLLAAVACGEEAEGGPPPKRRFYTVEDLPAIVLHPNEAPQGTEFLDDVSGPRDLEDLWSSSCCLGIQERFDKAGFQTAQVTVFERPGRSADPIDTRPGWELVSSSAVLFLTEEGADSAMDEWIDYFRSPVLDPVGVEGLGEDAVGMAGSPSAPAEQVYLYFWRHGRLVLVLRAIAGAETVPVEAVRRLVDRIEARAS